MEWISVLLIALLNLAAAIYTQYRLPYLTENRNQAMWARAILMITGVAFGLVAVKQIGSAALAA